MEIEQVQVESMVREGLHSVSVEEYLSTLGKVTAAGVFADLLRLASFLGAPQ